MQNNSMHQQTKIPSINVENRLRWTRPLVRMNNKRIPKQILYGKLQNGKRSQTRQMKRFKDCLKDSMKCGHIRTETWEWKATGRIRWRIMLHSGVHIFEDERQRHGEELKAGHKDRLISTRGREGDDGMKWH